MSSKVDIKVKGKSLVLPEDFSFDYEDVNPYFYDRESYSYEASVLVEENREVLGDVEVVTNDKKMVDFENESMTIMVDGLPFRTGLLQTSEDQEMTDSISISMKSTTKALSDLISDLNCRDIPMKDKIQIGEMIGNVLVDVSYRYRMEIIIAGSGNNKKGVYENESASNKLELHGLGYSFPGICSVTGSSELASQSNGKPVKVEDFINVSEPYPTKPYCNARVCYTHYALGDDGKSSENQSTKEKYDPYYVLEADRPVSGLCFYVLYFLDCLFKELDLSFDNSVLTGIGDFNRLCFFTTQCYYDLERKYTTKADSVFDFTNITDINNWLSTRNTKGQLSIDREASKKIDSIHVTTEVSDFDVRAGDKLWGETVKELKYTNEQISSSIKANIMNMYANSQNFPDESVSKVIDALWGGFGVKFFMDYEKKSIEAILIRDLYRNTESPITLQCEVVKGPYKINEKITGVRVKYSDESDNADKKSYLTTKSTDYDTNYDYTDYSNVSAGSTYVEILKKKSSSDKTCYIDLTTGNAYRIKVDKDAETTSELKPATFEVGGLSGVEIGDCRKVNDDFIEEITCDFQPIIPNDINGRYEKEVPINSTDTMTDGTSGVTYQIDSINSDNRKQILAMFVDEEMWHENILRKVQNVVSGDHADYYLTESLTTDESFDPTAGTDAESPLQSKDWGLAIGIMRGGGADATIEEYDYDFDKCGNSKWRTKAGEYAMSTDSIDNWGNEYDYNGTQTGIGDGERFSLKMRAYKTVDGEILCNEDVKDNDGNITKKVRSRGLFDSFMSEHAHFLLNRKKVGIEFRCEVSEITNIQWNRKYRIGNTVGWIGKLKSTITAKDGLGLVTAEMYIL